MSATFVLRISGKGAGSIHTIARMATLAARGQATIESATVNGVPVDLEPKPIDEAGIRALSEKAGTTGMERAAAHVAVRRCLQQLERLGLLLPGALRLDDAPPAEKAGGGA